MTESLKQFVNEYWCLQSLVSDALNGLGMSGNLRNGLKDLGFEIREGNHYVLTYYSDDRYLTTLAKTPSDVRGNKNEIAEIIIEMF